MMQENTNCPFCEANATMKNEDNNLYITCSSCGNFVFMGWTPTFEEFSEVQKRKFIYVSSKCKNMEFKNKNDLLEFLESRKINYGYRERRDLFVKFLYNNIENYHVLGYELLYSNSIEFGIFTQREHDEFVKYISDCEFFEICTNSAGRFFYSLSKPGIEHAEKINKESPALF